MNRRHFLGGAATLATGAMLRAQRSAAGRTRRILLHGKLQGMNIGTIGHTMGALSLLKRRLPGVEVVLWSSHNRPPKDPPDEAEVRALLARTFPGLRIVDGNLDGNGRPATPELEAAWRDADLLLHGSGSGFSARSLLLPWHRATGKPYGVCGVSTDPVSGFGPQRDPEGGTLDDLRRRIEKLPANHLAAATREVIARASFMYCRETMSRDYLRQQQVNCPVIDLGLDMQFDMDARDDAKAHAFLIQHGLKPQGYICVVPRLRYSLSAGMTQPNPRGEDAAKVAINARSAESDHAKLRELMSRWIRTTGLKVVACPEMRYQVKLAKDLLVDPLPPEIRRQVVWRDSFWMSDEAASVYAGAVAVISMECHSPIIALAMGTPALQVRQPTDTCKGQMFRDIGVNEWLYEADETTAADLWRTLDNILGDPAGARRRAAAAMTRATNIQHRMVETIRLTLDGGVARGTGSTNI